MKNRAHLPGLAIGSSLAFGNCQVAAAKTFVPDASVCKPPTRTELAWLVEPDIVRWWVVLSAKLKEPAANALPVRYLGLLDAASRVALGRFLLHQFIARDTAARRLRRLEHAARRCARK